MIWAYYVQLSTHMWDDETAEKRFIYLPQGSTGELFSDYKNNLIEESAWDKLMKDLAEKHFNTVVIDLGDGVKWDSHPEICADNAWSKELLKKKLDEIRALGMTPIPKINFSACHDTWMKEYRRMVGSSVYLKFCEDLICEACELFDKPELFHLGLDEECSEGCHSHSEAMVIRGTELLWHDYHFFMDVCRRNDARPWMWADYFWDRNELFVKNVPTDVLVSNWYYNNFRPYTQETWLTRSMDAYENLNKYGYDQVPTSSLVAGAISNPYETMINAKLKIDSNRLKGFMTAPWYSTTEVNLPMLKTEAHYFEYGRKLTFPETLK